MARPLTQLTHLSRKWLLLRYCTGYPRQEQVRCFSIPFSPSSHCLLANLLSSKDSETETAKLHSALRTESSGAGAGAQGRCEHPRCGWGGSQSHQIIHRPCHRNGYLPQAVTSPTGIKPSKALCSDGTRRAQPLQKNFST